MSVDLHQLATLNEYTVYIYLTVFVPGPNCYYNQYLYFLPDEMIVATPEANSPVIEDHPLNPNPASNWQNFFKVQ